MPTTWFPRIRRAKQLSVLNKGGTWAGEVTSALNLFNTLGFPVTLVENKGEGEVNVAVKLSNGPDSYPYLNDKLTTNSDWDAKLLHGLTITRTEGQRRRGKMIFEMVFAAIFLPGKVKATQGQKQVIIVHEFIHACGLDGGLPNGEKAKHQDHDSEGIMYDIMVPDGNGLIEGSKPSGVSSMPPIRVGGRTLCKLKSIWTDDGCEE
jgi:hypothetical protein